MRFSARLLLFLAIVAGCNRAAETPPVESSRPSIYLESPKTQFDPVFHDLSDHQLFPASHPDFKALALIFILPDCPIANSFLPEINRLHQQFSKQGVALMVVHADAEITSDKARQHAHEYQIQPPVILDPKHERVEKAGATVSPEAVVFSKEGEIVYRGRINDQYVGLGKRRGAITTHDLKDALEAIVAGKPVPQSSTEAIGCPIPN
jgi:hypothetical protein